MQLTSAFPFSKIVTQSFSQFHKLLLWRINGKQSDFSFNFETFLFVRGKQPNEAAPIREAFWTQCLRRN